MDQTFGYSTHYERESAPERPQSRAAAQRYGREIAPYLPIDRGGQILEIGVGNGLAMERLVTAGYVGVEGLEADERLARRLTANGFNVRHVPAQETVRYLLARPARYDLIYCMHVLEHVPVDEQLSFVRAIARALKSGGYFLCETPNALSPAACWHRYHDWTHRSIFTPESLSFLLENAELGVVDITAAAEAIPPARGALAAVLKTGILEVLRFASRWIWRVHLVSELGFAGIRLPLTPALLAVGRKR